MQAGLQQLPDTVWHYTSAQGLHGIVDSGRVWATDIRFLNDAQEFEWGSQLVNRLLGETDLTGRKEETVRIVRGLCDPSSPIVLRYMADLRLFVTCFCEKGDLLSQWRGYASGGYSIGFTPPALLTGGPLTTLGNALIFRKVLYETVAQEAAVAKLINDLIDYLDVDPSESSRADGFAANLVNGWAEVAAWFKHPAFEEEAEWRAIYAPQHDPSAKTLRHRSSGERIVPYVELTLPDIFSSASAALPIEEIMCGPSLEPLVKRAGVASLISKNPLYAGTRVTVSATPLRV